MELLTQYAQAYGVAFAHVENNTHNLSKYPHDSTYILNMYN